MKSNPLKNLSSCLQKSLEFFSTCRYTAVFDLQNRVLVLDNSTGIVIHVWKGYHHAQFGWINTMKDKDNPDPGASEFAILLVIYLPRRGLLEVWSPDQKSRLELHLRK